MLRLVAADRTHPGVVADECPAERDDLAVVAALVGLVDVKGAGVPGLVLRHGQFRTDELHRDTVPLPQPLAQVERLGELVAGVEVEDAHRRFDPGEHVQDAAALGAERRRHRQPRVEVPHRPAQDVLGRLAFQLGVRRGQLRVTPALGDHARPSAVISLGKYTLFLSA